MCNVISKKRMGRDGGGMGGGGVVLRKMDLITSFKPYIMCNNKKLLKRKFDQI